MLSSISNSSLGWLGKAALTAIVALLGVGFLVPVDLPFDETPIGGTATTNQLVVEHYVFDEATRPIVLVGSSMLTNVPPAHCRPSNVGSIYLQGGGAQTGMAAIARSGAKPDVVFVEISVGFMGVDETLLAPAFTPGWLSAKRLLPSLRSHRNWIIMLQRSFAPEAADTYVLPDVTVEEWKQRYAEAFAVFNRPTDNRRNMDLGYESFTSLVRQLQERGVRVVFYDPMDPELQALPQSEYWRSMVRDAFPDVEWIDPPSELELYHRDGMHLEIFSGIQFFDYMMERQGLDARSTCEVVPPDQRATTQ